MTESQALATAQKYLDDRCIGSTAKTASPKLPHVWIVEIDPPYGGTPHDPDKVRTAPVNFLMVYANGEIQPKAIPG